MSDNKSFAGIVQENFLDQDICRYIVSIVQNISWDTTQADSYWNDRVCSVRLLKQQVSCGEEIELLFSGIASQVNRVFSSHFSRTDLHPDTFDVVRWPNGSSQPPHSDAYKNDGTSNGLSHRLYGSLIYLNQSFYGGETYYPNFGFSVKPKIGTLVIHPGDLLHLHGVTEVNHGTRYTIAGFWTTDTSKSISLNHSMGT